jgi:hypothetical protein
MKPVIALLGIVLLLMGLTWVGQGAGYIRWPAESFMIDQSRWIDYGGGTAVIGFLTLIFALR